jgi:hypothetical protein
MGKIHRPDVVSHQQNLWIKVISSTPYHKGGWGGGFIVVVATDSMGICKSNS